MEWAPTSDMGIEAKPRLVVNTIGVGLPGWPVLVAPRTSPVLGVSAIKESSTISMQMVSTGMLPKTLGQCFPLRRSILDEPTAESCFQRSCP